MAKPLPVSTLVPPQTSVHVYALSPALELFRSVIFWCRWSNYVKGCRIKANIERAVFIILISDNTTERFSPSALFSFKSSSPLTYSTHSILKIKFCILDCQEIKTMRIILLGNFVVCSLSLISYTVNKMLQFLFLCLCLCFCCGNWGSDASIFVSIIQCLCHCFYCANWGCEII